MSNQLRKAPNYHHHETNFSQDEIVCLVGDKAWAYYDYGKGYEWGLIKDSLKLPNDYKPIIIGKDQLDNLNNLKLANKKHSNFRFYECGNLSIIYKNALELNLAKNTNAQNNIIPLHKNYEFNPKEYEDLNENNRLSTLEGDPLTNMVAETVKPDLTENYPEYFRGLPDNKKCDEFLSWLDGDLKRGNGSFYHFDGKYWKYLNDEDGLYSLIIKFFREKNIGYGYPTIERLFKLLKVEIEKLGNPNPDYLAFNNGVLNKRNGELMKHNKDYNLTSINGINYTDEEMETPYFNSWLEWVSEGNEKKANTILASLYAIATTRSDWHLFFEVSGCGASGKSTFHDIALMLVGVENSESLPLESLCSRFGKANIMNKSYLFSTDQEYFKGDGGTLRAIVSNGEIQIEQKGKDPITYKPRSMYVIITNSPCHFTERNGGIFRRRVIFLFNREVPKEQRIVDLAERLKKEVGGIMGKLIRKFNHNPEIAHQLLEEQRESTEALYVKEQIDPLHSFAKQFKTVETPSKRCLKYDCKVNTHNAETVKEQALYRAYIYWYQCQNISKGQMDKKTFKEVITQTFKERKMTVNFKFQKYDNTWHTNLEYVNKEQAFNDWEN